MQIIEPTTALKHAFKANLKNVVGDEIEIWL